MLQTLIAFANTAGGVLLLGVENRTKRVAGVAEPLREEERLANLIADRIESRLVPTIEIVAWRSVQVIAVEVYPSQNRPHYLKNLGPEIPRSRLACPATSRTVGRNRVVRNCHALSLFRAQALLRPSRRQVEHPDVVD